jgi:hypothetical protein
MRTASPLEHVIAHQDDYVRHIHGHFFRTLSSAACADAVQDAFIAASQNENFSGLDAAQCGAWVRTRAYRNAIDQIRLLNGRPDRGAPERATVVSLDELPLAGRDLRHKNPRRGPRSARLSRMKNDRDQAPGGGLLDVIPTVLGATVALTLAPGIAAGLLLGELLRRYRLAGVTRGSRHTQ